MPIKPSKGGIGREQCCHCSVFGPLHKIMQYENQSCVGLFLLELKIHIEKLLKEEKAEAWGLLPFDPKPPVHSVCENLIKKGLIRVADVTQPFPYRSNSFSLVLANDIVDSMTSKQLNVTLRELARVTSESVVILVSK